MKARPTLRFRWTDREGDLRDGVIWSISPDERRPEGVRYRLAFVPRGHARPAVLYDNHHPKGHHKHLGAREIPCAFSGVDALIADFEQDISAWKRAAGTRK